MLKKRWWCAQDSNPGWSRRRDSNSLRLEWVSSRNHYLDQCSHSNISLVLSTHVNAINQFCFALSLGEVVSLSLSETMITLIGWVICAVWPDWSTYWTLGNFLKHLGTINLPKSPAFFVNFCKGVKIYHFSSEIIFWATFIDIWRFFLVTLNLWNNFLFCSALDDNNFSYFSLQLLTQASR